MERRTSEELRADIVAAATQQFADRGYAGTAVQDIADVVGCSKQLVLYHFGSKEGLRAAVLETVRDAWTAFLPVLVDLASPDDDRLHVALQRVRTLLAEHPHVSRLVLRDLISEGGEVRAALYDLVRPTLALAGDGMAAVRGVDGERGLAQVQLIGVVLLATHAIYALDTPGLEGGVTPETMYAEAMDMIRRYLGGPAWSQPSSSSG